MYLTVDVVSNAICLWCYIGKRRLEKAIPANVYLYQNQDIRPASPIIQGEAMMMVGDQAVEGKPGTWIQMAP